MYATDHPLHHSQVDFVLDAGKGETIIPVLPAAYYRPLSLRRYARGRTSMWRTAVTSICVLVNCALRGKNDLESIDNVQL